MRDFEALGFVPCYRRNFRFLATMQHKRFKRFLLDRPFHVCRSMAELPQGSVAVEVTDRRSFPESRTHSQVRVRYEAAWPQAARAVPMTFFVHPIVYDQWLAYPGPDLAAARPWRIFFSGRVVGRKYGADLLSGKFGKMPRQQILRALEASLPADRLRRLLTAADLETGALQHPCFVWSDMTGYKIARPDWLGVLNRADFFLACPGTDMPLCHNLVEALSRGAVPILEHPEYLDPPLEHDVNCLVFHGREELLKTFDRVFEFSPEQIFRLRQGAYAYHQSHLAPGRFARRLLGLPYPRVDLLLNSYRTRRWPAGCPPLFHECSEPVPAH